MILLARKMWLSGAILIGLFAATGCGLMGGLRGSRHSEGGEEAIPLAVETNREPRIRSGVLLRIEVTSAGKAQVEVSTKDVSAKGEILMPMIGSVACDGLTIQELQHKLVLAYAEYVHEPQVTVSFVYTTDSVSPWGTVLVMGQVGRPGPVNIPPTRDLTVLRAIQMAGGATLLAAKSGVMVTRKQSDGGTRKIKVDLDKIGREGLWKLDIKLEPDDVVYVPESIM
jgi:polysaccharide export outer membrane protein